MGRGSADDWQPRTWLRLRGGRKAQREVLASSGGIDVHATNTEDARTSCEPIASGNVAVHFT